MSTVTRPTLEDLASKAGSEPEVGAEPDSQTQAWKEDLDKQAGQARLRGLEQDIEQRKRYALRLFVVLCVWLAAVLVILFFGGFMLGGFALNDSVLVALLGTTTINVIALFVVVAKYIFPRP